MSRSHEPNTFAAEIAQIAGAQDFGSSSLDEASGTSGTDASRSDTGTRAQDRLIARIGAALSATGPADGAPGPTAIFTGENARVRGTFDVEHVATVINEGGDTATYTFTITVSAADAATRQLMIESIVNDKLGDLLPVALAGYSQTHPGATSIVLNPGDALTFSFVSPAIVLNAEETRTYIVSVAAPDNPNVSATGMDDHTAIAESFGPSLTVEKTTDDQTIDEGNGAITYTYAVTNTSTAAADSELTLTSLVDDLGTADTNDDIDLLDGGIKGAHYVSGDTDNDNKLDNSEVWTYRYTADVMLEPGESLTSIVSAMGRDNEGTETAATGEATVTAVDAIPTLIIEKTSDIDEVNAGDACLITYTVTITAAATNASTDPLTVTSVTDDVLGNLMDAALAAWQSKGNIGPMILDAGASLTFAVEYPYDPNAGGTLTSVVTVAGTDNEGNVVTDDAVCSVSEVDADPAIKVVKTANVASIAEGMPTDVTFTYSVTNESADPTDQLTIESVIDDRHGPATLKSGDDDGDGLLEKGETWIYETVAHDVTLNADDDLASEVVVTAHDDENNAVCSTDTLTLPVQDVLPEIRLAKTVDANTDGVFHDSETVQAGTRTVAYRYEITNTGASTDPLALQSLTDDTVDLSSFDLSTNAGDANGNSLIDTGETWIYELATSISLSFNHDLLASAATVAALDDEANKAFSTDTAAVESFDGPGVRTLSFWSNNGKLHWDGISENEKQSGPNLPGGELLAGQANLILGGDHDNLLEAGEMQISISDALSFVNPATKHPQDGRWILVRDAVATELNIRAGNPGSDDDPWTIAQEENADTIDPQDLLDEAVNWLLNTSGDDSVLSKSDLTGASKVSTSSSLWKTDMFTNEYSASELHTQLESYNSTGIVFGVLFANDGDKV